MYVANMVMFYKARMAMGSSCIAKKFEKPNHIIRMLLVSSHLMILW